MGGAQAIFALAYGTETIDPVDVIAGPGNRMGAGGQARRLRPGRASTLCAGPSELMLIAGADTEPEWAALDLCAQAEHGNDGALVAVAVEEAVLDSVAAATERAASERPDVGDAPWLWSKCPISTPRSSLQTPSPPSTSSCSTTRRPCSRGRVTTAGCVFTGRFGATAFGDYAAGSNHVLPTGGAGRFSGPLGPGVFRRKISEVDISAEAAAALAPHVDTLARAEGFPVHAESAMIRR